jgi:hypothetical protein
VSSRKRYDNVCHGKLCEDEGGLNFRDSFETFPQVSVEKSVEKKLSEVTSF